MKASIIIVSALLAATTASQAQSLALVSHPAADNSETASPAETKTVAADPRPAFTFQVYGDIPNAKPVFEEDHFLGEPVTTKWNTFLSNYTRTYDVEIGLSSSGTEFRKPAVYKAVEKANKWVKKAIRTKSMSVGTAVETMVHVLDCANWICLEEDTKEVERAAADVKTGEEALAFFRSIKLERE